MPLAYIGATVVIARQSGGDVASLITKVITNDVVNIVAFDDADDGDGTHFEKFVKIHPDRAGALNATIKDGKPHLYWPAK